MAHAPTPHGQRFERHRPATHGGRIHGAGPVTAHARARERATPARPPGDNTMQGKADVPFLGTSTDSLTFNKRIANNCPGGKEPARLSTVAS